MWSGLTAGLAIMFPPAISWLISCEGRIPVVRACPSRVGNSGPFSKAIWLWLGVDIFKFPCCFLVADANDCTSNGGALHFATPSLPEGVSSVGRQARRVLRSEEHTS